MRSIKSVPLTLPPPIWMPAGVCSGRKFAAASFTVIIPVIAANSNPTITFYV
jgi:hypothetical protein